MLKQSSPLTALARSRGGGRLRNCARRSPRPEGGGRGASLPWRLEMIAGVVEKISTALEMIAGVVEKISNRVGEDL